MWNYRRDAVFCCAGLFLLFIAIYIWFQLRSRRKGEQVSTVSHTTILYAILAVVAANMDFWYNQAHGALKDMYDDAILLSEQYHSREARAIFEKMPKYLDSADRAKACARASAEYLISQNQYVEAMNELGAYADDDACGKLIEQARQSLHDYNAENGYFTNGGAMQGRWREENGTRIFEAGTKEDGRQYISSNLEKSEAVASAQVDCGIYKRYLENGEEVIVAAFQYDLNAPSRILAYLCKTNEMIILLTDDTATVD